MVSEREMLKSLDYRWLNQNRSVWLGMMIFGFVMAFVFHMIELHRFLLTALLFSLICFIFAIVYHIQSIYIVKNYKDYEKQEVILNEAHISFLFKLVYYRVEIKISETETKVLSTRPMWTSRYVIEKSNFKTQGYSNKTVYVAYDKKKDKVYVLGLKKEEE